MPVRNPQPLDDKSLLTAHTTWDTAKWDTHFNRLGVKAGSEARYKVSAGNDVLKYAIAEVHGRRCWWQGSHDCQSRALLLRDLQIDHIIPQKAEVTSLAEAIRTSEYQDQVFDVHDPGNLALICGPCNQEKGAKFKKTYKPKPGIESRREAHEKNRGSVIHKVAKWHGTNTIDDANVQLLLGTDLTDPEVRDIFLQLSTEMLFKLAESFGQVFPVSFGTPVVVENEDYELEVRPSAEAIQAHVDSLEEMAADDRRA